MSIEGQGHFFTIYFPGFVCFVLYKAMISGERLQDHWSSGSLFLLKNLGGGHKFSEFACLSLVSFFMAKKFGHSLRSDYSFRSSLIWVYTAFWPVCPNIRENITFLLAVYVNGSVQICLFHIFYTLAYK